MYLDIVRFALNNDAICDNEVHHQSTYMMMIHTYLNLHQNIILMPRSRNSLPPIQLQYSIRQPILLEKCSSITPNLMIAMMHLLLLLLRFQFLEGFVMTISITIIPSRALALRPFDERIYRIVMDVAVVGTAAVYEGLSCFE